jgi:hypothetical protein
VLNKQTNLQYLIDQINKGEVVVVDDFFKDFVCEYLRLRMLTSTFFDKQYKDDQAIDYNSEDSITKEISSKVESTYKLKKFNRAWSFLYNNVARGTEFHADPSFININIWVTPNRSINNFNKNGLIICNKRPPSDWTRDNWNGNKDNCIDNFLNENSTKYIKIPYRYNRAIFFNGALFHRTNGVETKPGMEHRRVSYTMLFGEDLE